ncbi:hypothetical protein [Thermosynechococcus sp. FA-CM-4201]
MAALGIVGLIFTVIEEKSSRKRGDIRAAEEARKLGESISKGVARDLSKVFWNDNKF